MNIQNVHPFISRSGGDKIGDPIIYGFKLPYTGLVPSINIEFQDPSKNEEILVATQNITIIENKVVYKAVIIPFKTGKITVPSININSINILPVDITVNSVLNKRVTPNIESNYPLFSDNSDISLVLLLLIIGSVLFIYIKKHLAFKKLPKPLNSREKQLLWLSAVNIFKEAVSPDEVKEYYFDSSDKLKEFVDKVLGFSIMESTVNEIMNYFKNINLEKKELLLELLGSADPVKFAKYFPDKNELEIYQKTALEFLEFYEPKEESGVENN